MEGGELASAATPLLALLAWSREGEEAGSCCELEEGDSCQTQKQHQQQVWKQV